MQPGSSTLMTDALLRKGHVCARWYLGKGLRALLGKGVCTAQDKWSPRHLHSLGSPASEAIGSHLDLQRL